MATGRPFHKSTIRLYKNCLRNAQVGLTWLKILILYVKDLKHTTGRQSQYDLSDNLKKEKSKTFLLNSRGKRP